MSDQRAQTPPRKLSFSSMNGAFQVWHAEQPPTDSGTPKRARVSSNHSHNWDNSSFEPLRESYPRKQHPLVVSATCDLLEVYRKCNPRFRYTLSLNPKRVLTKECQPVDQYGLDNQFSDLILHVNDRLSATSSTAQEVYHVKELLGQGTFGQVVKCNVLPAATRTPRGSKSNAFKQVAVKVVKSKPAYYNQALVEVAILEKLNSKGSSKGRKRIVNLLDSFTYHGHLCLVFELLAINLFEVIHQNKYRGLKMSYVKSFCAQILEALQVLSQLGIVHCDLKPENILLENLQSAKIKVIDFGSACFENQTVYTYIQSRFYRAPEVLLGLPYNRGIDIWSLGCIALELFIGLPVFPGVSEHNQLARIMELMGTPPTWMIAQGKNTLKFFTRKKQSDYGLPPLHLQTLLNKNEHATLNPVFERDQALSKQARQHGSAPRKLHQELPPREDEVEGTWRLKSALEWAESEEKPLDKTKRYFLDTNLSDVVHKYKARIMPAEGQKGIEVERMDRRSLLNFVSGLLQLDPGKRWTANQAAAHPFVTGTVFMGSFSPPPEPSRNGRSKKNRLHCGNNSDSPSGGQPPTASSMTPTSHRARFPSHDLAVSMPVNAGLGVYSSAFTSDYFQAGNRRQSSVGLGPRGVMLGQGSLPGGQNALAPELLARRSSIHLQDGSYNPFNTLHNIASSPHTSLHLSPPSRPMHPYPLAHSAQWDRAGSLPSALYLDGLAPKRRSLPIPIPGSNGLQYSLSGRLGGHPGSQPSAVNLLARADFPLPGSAPVFHSHSILNRVAMLDDGGRRHSVQHPDSPLGTVGFALGGAGALDREGALCGTPKSVDGDNGDSALRQRRPRGQSESFATGFASGFQTSPARMSLKGNASHLRRNSFHVASLDVGVPYRFGAATWALPPGPQPQRPAGSAANPSLHENGMYSAANGLEVKPLQSPPSLDNWTPFFSTPQQPPVPPDESQMGG